MGFQWVYGNISDHLIFKVEKETYMTAAHVAKLLC